MWIIQLRPSLRLNLCPSSQSQLRHTEVRKTKHLRSAAFCIPADVIFNDFSMAHSELSVSETVNDAAIVQSVTADTTPAGWGDYVNLKWNHSVCRLSLFSLTLRVCAVPDYPRSCQSIMNQSSDISHKSSRSLEVRYNEFTLYQVTIHITVLSRSWYSEVQSCTVKCLTFNCFECFSDPLPIHCSLKVDSAVIF